MRLQTKLNLVSYNEVTSTFISPNLAPIFFVDSQSSIILFQIVVLMRVYILHSYK